MVVHAHLALLVQRLVLITISTQGLDPKQGLPAAAGLSLRQIPSLRLTVRFDRSRILCLPPALDMFASTGPITNSEPDRVLILIPVNFIQQIHRNSLAVSPGLAIASILSFEPIRC
jgi:hypothetical protein